MARLSLVALVTVGALAACVSGYNTLFDCVDNYAGGPFMGTPLNAGLPCCYDNRGLSFATGYGACLTTPCTTEAGCCMEAVYSVAQVSTIKVTNKISPSRAPIILRNLTADGNLLGIPRYANSPVVAYASWHGYYNPYLEALAALDDPSTSTIDSYRTKASNFPTPSMLTQYSMDNTTGALQISINDYPADAAAMTLAPLPAKVLQWLAGSGYGCKVNAMLGSPMVAQAAAIALFVRLVLLPYD